MKKEERIERYGLEAYEKQLKQNREWYEANSETEKARSKKWREEHSEIEKAYNKKYKEEHPEVVLASNREQCRKGGKYYEKALEYKRTGIPGERNKLRMKHAIHWRPYKQIISPDSQIHHEWVPETVKYRGIALVEKDQHMHGFIDVIQILDGQITLFTEEEVRNAK